MTTLLDRLVAATDEYEENVDKIDEFVNGADDETVTTRGGEVKTIANIQASVLDSTAYAQKDFSNVQLPNDLPTAEGTVSKLGIDQLLTDITNLAGEVTVHGFNTFRPTENEYRITLIPATGIVDTDNHILQRDATTNDGLIFDSDTGNLNCGVTGSAGSLSEFAGYFKADTAELASYSSRKYNGTITLHESMQNFNLLLINAHYHDDGGIPRVTYTQLIPTSRLVVGLRLSFFRYHNGYANWDVTDNTTFTFVNEYKSWIRSIVGIGRKT